MIIQITVLQFSTFEVPEDIQVKVIGGKDSEHQNGRGIECSFDGKFTPEADGYHSLFGKSANFPVSLEYYFEPDTEIVLMFIIPVAGKVILVGWKFIRPLISDILIG